MNQLTDEALILLKAARGDREAFAILYTFYTPYLYRLLYPLTNESKEDTEEIIQEIFLRIWEKKEILFAVQSFKAYVFRMGRNIMVDQFRKRSVRKRLAAEVSGLASDTAPGLEDDLLFIEYQTIAAQAIDRLPPRQRQIFDLRTKEDMSLNDISAELGIGLPAVKKQLYEAIHSVKAWLQEKAGWAVSAILIFFLNG